MQHTHKTLSFKLFYYYLLCILTSIWLLRAPKSWLKHFFQPFSGFFVQKKIFRPPFGCAQHPKAGRNTQQLLYQTKVKSQSMAPSQCCPGQNWLKNPGLNVNCSNDKWLSDVVPKYLMHVFKDKSFSHYQTCTKLFTVAYVRQQQTLWLLKTSGEGGFDGHSKSGSCLY